MAPVFDFAAYDTTFLIVLHSTSMIPFSCGCSPTEQKFTRNNAPSD